MNSNIRDFTNKSTDIRKSDGEKASEAAVRAARGGNNTTRDIAEAAASANATLEEFGINTDQMVDAARRRTNDLQDAFADAVRANPLRSVAIAAVAGYIYALTRR